MDVLGRTSMKDAANCDKHCEWQNSANQQNAERILLSQVLPGRMSDSERFHLPVLEDVKVSTSITRVTFLCASDASPEYPLAHQIE